MRQLPEQCEACKKQIATLETCVLPDGTEKRGAEATFRESAEGGIRCVGCAGAGKEGERPVVRSYEVRSCAFAHIYPTPQDLAPPSLAPDVRMGPGHSTGSEPCGILNADFRE